MEINFTGSFFWLLFVSIKNWTIGILSLSLLFRFFWPRLCAYRNRKKTDGRKSKMCSIQNILSLGTVGSAKITCIRVWVCMCVCVVHMQRWPFDVRWKRERNPVFSFYCSFWCFCFHCFFLLRIVDKIKINSRQFSCHFIFDISTQMKTLQQTKFWSKFQHKLSQLRRLVCASATWTWKSGFKLEILNRFFFFFFCHLLY